jgi:hypothetical protein
MKKFFLVLLCCFFATSAFANSSSLQLSLVPDVALEARTTFINGVSIGIWSENPQKAFALGIVNGSTGDSSGLALGLLGNYAENYRGVQLAWLGNYASGTLSGVQWSAFNYAGKLNGLQIGFLNYSGAAEQGVQIGLINIMNETKQWFSNFPNEVAPAMVFVNWRF